MTNGIKQRPKVIYYKDQSIPASKWVELDLSIYFEPQKDDRLTYCIEECPAGLTIDENTGILTGISPPDVANRSYVVHLTATSSLSGFSSHVIFNLHVLVTPLEEDALTQEFADLAQQITGYENRFFLQYAIDEHFLYIQLQGADFMDEDRGPLLDVRTADTGWLIYNHKYSIIISPGEMAFVDGNRGRFLRTLAEVYVRDVPQRDWQSFFILGSDIANVGRAWVVAKQHQMPVSDYAPDPIAEINLLTIEKHKAIKK